VTERTILALAVALYFITYGAAALWRKQAPMFRRAGFRHPAIKAAEGQLAVLIGVISVVIGFSIAVWGFRGSWN
jgi:hypothetical protein